jgi:Holliday junction resolvase RusA-like endonuclease
VYQDDEQIDDLRIIRMGIEKPGRVEIEIEEIDGSNSKT